MRMNYKTYPTDYLQALKQSRGIAGRKKARAFMEYWDDMEHAEHNSYGFYAKSWEVSKSTSFEWIKEFDKEIDLFLCHWQLKNREHTNYAQNTSERLTNKTNALKAHNTGEFRESTERLTNEDLNHTNKNTSSGFLFSKAFNDLFFVYSRNTRYVGNKIDAYEAFCHLNVDVDLLKLAAMKYLHDKAVDRPVGIKKFLDNEIYLAYLPNYMKVKSADLWYEGIYNNATYEFKTKQGELLGTIEPKLLLELYEKKELIYLTQLGLGRS